MRRWFLLVLLLLLLTGVAAALDCSSLEGEKLNDCNAVVGSDLLAQAKKESILALLNSDSFLPNFTFVEAWNSNIVFGAAPYGVPVRSSSYIKDAWLKVVAVTPSVAVNGTVLVPSEGKVLSAYNYRVEVPSGTVDGDCRTDYALSGSSANLDVYANGVLEGHGNLTPFQISGDAVFTSKLRVDAEISVSHHQDFKYCCDTSNGYCTKYCVECVHKYTETLSDSVKLEDSLGAAFYEPKTSYALQATDLYYNTTSARLNFSNFTEISLSFENSSYEKRFYAYELAASLQPYDVLSYKAIPQQSSESSNLNAVEDGNSVTFTVKNTRSCALKLSNHFGSEPVSCSLDYSETPFSIATAKLSYSEGEAISVSILPKDKSVRVTYANQSLTAVGNASFTAVYPYNRITAVFADKTADRVVAVQKRGQFSFLFGVSVFSGLNYVLYAALRKYWGWHL